MIGGMSATLATLIWGKYVKRFIGLIITIYSVYLSFECNQGFNLGSFLVALCCSIFYIPYRWAVSCK